MKYRPDIDGIRAVAILLVVLFHYGVPGFTGGFIGVDVFFVLSGYLIGSIVFSQLEQQRFSFVNFYFRRVRRLFPAYIVMMIVTLIGAWLWLLPQDLREFGQSLLASTVYLSNILFYREAGYFDTASHLKPLLHTWSLSVEEQFYLVFPFVAWATAALRRQAIVALFCALTVASFVAAVSFIETDTSAVFYLYPFRAWEMFIGTVLALRVVQAPAATGAAVSSGLGLLLIVVPALLYDDSTLFPGLSALAPCLGTALLLYGGTGPYTAIQRVLAAGVPVYIGKISYSLYLWHWPVYVLYAYNRPLGLSVTETITAALITTAAAALSYRYVEQPVREATLSWTRRPAVVFPVAAAASAAFIAAGVQMHLSNGLPGRLDARTAAFAAAAGDLFGDMSDCHTFGNARLPDIEYCTIGDPFEADSYTLVWGDSHAGAYRRGYESAFDGLPHNALLAWTGGCPPVFGLSKDESVSSAAVDASCSRRNNAIAELLAADERIDAVVLIGRWSYYLRGGGVGIDSHNRIRIWPQDGDDTAGDQSDLFVASLERTIERLGAAGLPVFVVEQPPEFSEFRARVLAVGLMNGSGVGADAYATTVEDYSAVVDRQGPVQASLEAADADGRITLLRTHEYFCDTQRCSLMRDDAPLYFDNNHLSTAGSMRISEMFAPLRDYVARRIETAAQAR